MSTPSTFHERHVVIVGAGHAGGTLAALLRQANYDGPITLLGDEPFAPYQRPPLSKGWLKGEADGESILLRPLSWYATNAVDLRLGGRVDGIDLAARTVRLADGEEIGFGRLAIATGARARTLNVPGADLGGVFSLRGVADAVALKTSLGPRRSLGVIGGGYVGLEAAASARFLGADAVVLEREPRILARVACPELSAFYTAQHLARGVRIELGVEVVALEGDENHVRGVRLSDGRLIACDVALVGVGAQPNDELARAAGLRCDDGVIVDEQAQTSHPRVWAIGDVARRPLLDYDRLHRLESVPNAIEQAKHVTAALTGRPAPTLETPWFWSDQYDLKLQIAGLPFDCDERVTRGGPLEPPFTVFHLKDSHIRAVEAVNAPANFMASRRLIASRTRMDKAKLADPSCALKDAAIEPL